MLDIKNLHAGVDGKEILKGLNLYINPGEMHAIMGRNGSGKSTLANVITGREDYNVMKGDILFARRNAYLRRCSAVDFDGICSGDAIVLRRKNKN